MTYVSSSSNQSSVAGGNVISVVLVTYVSFDQSSVGGGDEMGLAGYFVTLFNSSQAGTWNWGIGTDQSSVGSGTWIGLGGRVFYRRNPNLLPRNNEDPRVLQVLAVLMGRTVTLLEDVCLPNDLNMTFVGT